MTEILMNIKDIDEKDIYLQFYQHDYGVQFKFKSYGLYHLFVIRADGMTMNTGIGGHDCRIKGVDTDFSHRLKIIGVDII